MRLTSLKYKLRVALCILCVGLCSIGIYAQETQTDIDFLKQFQQGLEKGPIGEAIKVMKDSAGINVYPAFHIADDSALWPYVLELYFDVRIKRKEPYLLTTLVLEPSTGKWTDFSKYSIRVTLTQSQQKAIPQTVLLAAEKHLNEILSDITNLKDYFTQIRDYIAETIQKLRFAMMDKYWEGRQLPLVSFYPGNNQQFGFDSPIQESIIGKYKNFYRYDSITRVPWKALSTTTPDKVNAYIQLRDNAFTKSHVRFINRNSETVFPVQTAGDTLVFQLTGLSKENEDQLTAEYFDTDPLGKERKASLGQVNTIAYENESNTVHIVPVGNAQYPGTKADLESYLNKVYKQAVVQWIVIFDNPIKVKDWDMDGNDTLNIETSLFSRYSDEEQAFVDVLEKQTNYDPKAAYLFVVDMANNMNARGYMPLSAQYGFIFTKVNQSVHDEVYHNTVAHEAGHGVYKLQHPWDIYGTPKYQTDNLMDYQFGATLWKPQWDWIHDPGMRLYLVTKVDKVVADTIVHTENLTGSDSALEAQNGTLVGSDSISVSGKVLATMGVVSTGTGNVAQMEGNSVASNVMFDVQQDILQIGFGQNIPVAFAVLHNLKDTSNARVDFYVDNPTYNRQDAIASLEDRDIKTGQPLSTIGDKFYHLSWIPKLEMQTFPEPGKHELTFNLVQNNKQLAQKKLEIEILPKYELTGLTAVDANNLKRVAKAGETLYLVAKRLSDNTLPNRKIIYNCITTNPNDVYWPGQPYWKVDGTMQNFVGKKYEYTTKNWPKLENFSQPGKNTIEAFAYEKSFTVNVEWLRENKQSSSVVPFDMKPKIEQITKIGDVLTTQIQKLGGVFKAAGVKATTEFKFSNVNYNREDNNTRFYIKAQDAAISYGAKLETTDLPIPGISTPPVLSKFINLGAFWSIKVEGKIQVNLIYEGLSTSQTLTFGGAKTSGSLEGGIKLGIKAAILPTIKEYINMEVKGYATVGIIGLIEVKMPKEENSTFKIQLRTAPIVLGWSANVKLADWELVDYKSEIAICDSYNIGCIGNGCN